MYDAKCMMKTEKKSYTKEYFKDSLYHTARHKQFSPQVRGITGLPL